MRQVSVDIVTGFLGAGKTTLLAHVLEGRLKDEKVAVIMNEIGDVGVDGRVITGLEYVENMVELNSGCICCTIDDYRFDLAIDELIEKADPTLIIIESTGVADPDPVVFRVKQAGLGLDAVITVVDALNLSRALDEAKVARTQIEAADFLVVNKIDLVGDRDLARIRRKLRRLNRRAMLIETDHGRLATDLPFGTSARRHRQVLAGRSPSAAVAGSSHMKEDHIEVFSYEGDDEFDQRRFERFLQRLPSALYRAKGLVRIAGNDWSCLFNYTCGRYELSWIKLRDDGAGTQAVFIGRDIGAERDRILEALAGCRAD